MGCTCVHIPYHKYRAQSTYFGHQLFSFNHVYSGDGTQVINLYNKYLYQLSNLLLATYWDYNLITCLPFFPSSKPSHMLCSVTNSWPIFYLFSLHTYRCISIMYMYTHTYIILNVTFSVSIILLVCMYMWLSNSKQSALKTCIQVHICLHTAEPSCQSLKSVFGVSC